MQRRDRRLQLVEPGSAPAHRILEQTLALADPPAIPQRAVLIVEQHELAVFVDACGTARVVQQHQREQARDLGVVGHQAVQQSPQADRLGAQLAAHQPIAGGGEPALVEDQVQDREHAGQQSGSSSSAGTL